MLANGGHGSTHAAVPSTPAGSGGAASFGGAASHSGGAGNSAAGYGAAAGAPRAASACDVPFALGGLPIRMTEQSSRALALGDWNGDGKSDLATANGDSSTSGSVSVFLGNGNGTFGARADYPAGLEATAIVSGDFDHDGHADLAVADNRSNSVQLLLGLGDGSLAAGDSYPVAGGPRAIIATDLNRDSLSDLAVVTDAADDVYVLLGTANGGFRSSVYDTRAWQFIDAGDFNGDGAIDLITSSMRYDPNPPPAPGLYVFPSVSVLLGRGDGTFSSTLVQSMSSNVAGGTVADLDGDGKLDLLATIMGERGFIGPSVFIGRGDGTFAESDFQPTIQAPQLIAGDFNADGHTDLSGIDRSRGEVNVRLGSGGALASGAGYGKGLSPSSFALADLDCDGKLDFATVGNDSESRVGALLGNGDGSFTSVRQYGSSGYGELLSCDMNQDGQLDAILADRDAGTFDIFWAGANGTFREVAKVSTGNRSLTSMAVGDVDADGAPDLIWITAEGVLRLISRRNNSKISQLPEVTSKLDYATIGDLDRDGYADLITVSQVSSVVTSWHFDGAKFVRMGESRFDFSPDWLELRDVDGDTQLDLMTQRGVLLGKGDGSFASEQYVPPPPVEIAYRTFADLNEDGRFDRVGRTSDGINESDVDVLLLGTSDGGFSVERLPIAMGYRLRDAALADLDGDGHVDLAILHDDMIDVRFGAGDGTFACSLQYAASGAESLVISDVNGDGRLDLLTPGWETSALRVLPNTPIGPGACR